MQADICDYPAIVPLFDGVDWVFHMAALADIVPSIQRPQDYFHYNFREYRLFEKGTGLDSGYYRGRCGRLVKISE